MRQLGKELQEQRERLSLTLDDIHAITKIRKRYLEALEMGDWSILPGTVYARGFVRSYAEAIGLDGQTLLDKYGGQCGTAPAAPERTEATVPVVGESAPAPEPREKVKQNPEPISLQSLSTHSQPPKRKSPPAKAPATRPSPAKKVNIRAAVRKKRSTGAVLSQTAVVAGILVILGGGWWFINQSGSKAAGSKNGTVSSSDNQPITASIPPANNTLSNNVVTNSTPPTNSGTNSVDNNTASVPGNNSTTAAATPSVPQVVKGPFNGKTQVYQVITNQTELNVSMTSSPGNCWVMVTADNKVIDGSDMILAGQAHSWKAKQNLTIELGHVQGVSLTVNGQAVELPSTNNVVYVTFQRNSAQG